MRSTHRWAAIQILQSDAGANQCVNNYMYLGFYANEYVVEGAFTCNNLKLTTKSPSVDQWHEQHVSRDMILPRSRISTRIEAERQLFFEKTMNLTAQSHKSQLILAAAAGSVATLAVVSSYQAYTRKRRRQQLRDEIKDALARQDSSSQLTDLTDLSASSEIVKLVTERVQPIQERLLRGDYPEELFREQLARCYALFKEDGMTRMRNARVVVVGCGGVGSWAAVMLVRSCVESRTPVHSTETQVH